MDEFRFWLVWWGILLTISYFTHSRQCSPLIFCLYLINQCQGKQHNLHLTAHLSNNFPTFTPGFISLWMKFLLCINSMRPIIWSASIRTVFMVKRRLQKLKRSSREGPKRSITKILYCCSWPNHLEQKQAYIRGLS